MNAYKYLHSRLGKVIESIKQDYVSGKHIVFLITGEPDVVRGVIESASVLPCRKKKLQNGFVAEGNVFFTNGDFMNADIKSMSIEEPSLYVYQPLNIYERENTKSNRWFQSLDTYVAHYSGLSCVNEALPKTHLNQLDALKRSLILVVLPEETEIPENLVPYADQIVVPYMEKGEFQECVSMLLHELDGIALHTDAWGYDLIDDKMYLDKLYHNMRGINATQVKALLRKNKAQLGKLYFNANDDAPEADKEGLAKLLRNIREQAEHIISSSTALTICESSKQQPAGLKNLFEWIMQHKLRVIEPQNFEYYILDSPKGILVSGIPGSGKSMMAKFIAGTLGLSLIKLDLGDVLGSLVGESEKNMNKALRLVEALSPCVLWVDEMEKAFAGASGNGGHEVTKRLVGKFLTWMQEKRTSCFVFATANDISQMPPEMFRSGRFDEKFYTFMPTSAECGEIFESIIRSQCKKFKQKQGEDSIASLFDENEINAAFMQHLLENECIVTELHIGDRQVVRSNKFFTGSDIEQVITKAKTIYLNRKLPSAKTVVFDTANFTDCMKSAIREMRTYGETNLKDIARCYAGLVNNNFVSASANILLPFEGYDELRYATREGNPKDCFLYQLPDENRHLATKCTSKYDKQLYLVVKNTINLMANELINKR